MITFAVAAYNSEKYIRSCIDSILSQSDDDFEVLIVDDGSTDNTWTICDEYAEKDRRIRVIHQTNSGIADVRNISLELAKGDWLCFVDGDDRLADGAYDVLKKEIDEKYDIIYFSMQSFVYDHALPLLAGDTVCKDICEDELKILRYDTLYVQNNTYYRQNIAMRSLCAKAFRTDFIRKYALKAESILSYGEDMIFMLDCLKNCKRVKTVSTPFYLYRKRNDSVMHKYNPEITRKITTLIGVKHERSENDPEMMRRFYMDCITDIRLILMLDICHKDNKKSFRQKKSDFEKLVGLPEFAEAIEKVDADHLKENDKICLEYIKNNDFIKIYHYFAQKGRTEKIKDILNKTGAVKLLRPIRDKIGRKHK